MKYTFRNTWLSSCFLLRTRGEIRGSAHILAPSRSSPASVCWWHNPTVLPLVCATVVRVSQCSIVLFVSIFSVGCVVVQMSGAGPLYPEDMGVDVWQGQREDHRGQCAIRRKFLQTAEQHYKFIVEPGKPLFGAKKSLLWILSTSVWSLLESCCPPM